MTKDYENNDSKDEKSKLEEAEYFARIISGANGTGIGQQDQSLMMFAISLYQIFFWSIVNDWLNTKKNPKKVISKIFKRWKDGILSHAEPEIQKHIEMMETNLGKLMENISGGKIGDGESMRIGINKKIKLIEKSMRPTLDKMAEDIEKDRGL